MTAPASVTTTVRIRTPNFANGSHGHWARVAKARKAQRRAAWAHLLKASPTRPALPVAVTLVRHSSGTLDSDNLQSALKAPRDGIADYFGIPDNDPRLSFHYRQAKAPPGGSAVTILIETHAAGDS